MEYISHEDYKKMLTGFGKEVPKAKLNEGLEKEGNAFTAGLAKTKRGGEFKVGDKEFTDKTNYDAQVNEYQFDQMYPDDPGPFEDKNFMDPDESDFTMAVADQLNDEHWGLTPEQMDAAESYLEANYYELQGDFANNHEIGGGSGRAAEYIVNLIKKQGQDTDFTIKEFLAKEDDLNFEAMDGEMEEDINLPSSQPTGPSIEEKRSRLAHLTSEERDQLKQYVETIRTVKEEIKKMVGKKDMEEGGDNTNLIMQPTTVSEEGGGEHEEIESNLDPKIHDAFHKVTGMAVKSLIKAGIEPDQIKAFFQHEISELPDFVSSQYEGRRDSMKKNPFLEPTLKSYQDGTHKKDMKKVDDITATMEKFYKKYYPNTPRSEWNLVQMIDHPKFKGL